MLDIETHLGGQVWFDCHRFQVDNVAVEHQFHVDLTCQIATLLNVSDERNHLIHKGCFLRNAPADLQVVHALITTKSHREDRSCQCSGLLRDSPKFAAVADAVMRAIGEQKNRLTVCVVSHRILHGDNKIRPLPGGS